MTIRKDGETGLVDRERRALRNFTIPRMPRHGRKVQLSLTLTSFEVVVR